MRYKRVSFFQIFRQFLIEPILIGLKVQSEHSRLRLDIFPTFDARGGFSPRQFRLFN